MKCSVRISATAWITALVLAYGGASTVFAVSIEYFDHAAFAAAAGNLNIVTFDNVPTETVLNGSEFSGLQISGRRRVIINPQNFAPGLAVGGTNVNSQPNGLSASLFYSSPGTIVFDNLDDNFTFTLLVSTHAAGLWIGNVGATNSDTSTPTVVRFFDTNGTELVSETFTQGHVGQIGSGVNNRFFYGVLADVDIGAITTTNAASDADGIIYDDVQWAAATVVPEPATVSLLALGFIGLLVNRWAKGYQSTYPCKTETVNRA